MAREKCDLSAMVGKTIAAEPTIKQRNTLGHYQTVINFTFSDGSSENVIVEDGSEPTQMGAMRTQVVRLEGEGS